MSIREQWKDLVRQGLLFELPPFPGDRHARTVLMSETINKLVVGPWDDQTMGDRCARLAAGLQGIVRGNLLKVCMTPFAARQAQLGRLAPIEDSVFDFRKVERVQGCVCFVASRRRTSWWRSFALRAQSKFRGSIDFPLVIDIPNTGNAAFANALSNGRSFSQSTTRYWETISMSISHTQLLNEIGAGHDGPPIPPAKLAYFQERLRGRIFDFILGIFLEEQKNGLTQAKLARRIGKKADVISRWLGTPSNLTVDTISDLLVGI